MGSLDPLDNILKLFVELVEEEISYLGHCRS